MNDKLTMPILDYQVTSRSLRELYFELGQALSIRYRYAEATSMFQKALEAEDAGPGNGEILLHLAEIQFRAGDHQDALHCCLDAIAFEPVRCDAILPIAHELLTRNIVASEHEWLQHTWMPQIVNIHVPANTDSANTDSVSLQWMPKIAEADLTVEARAALAFFLGRISLYLEEYTTTLAFFQEAVQLLPDDVRVVEGFGEVLWRLGQLEQATEALSRARELSEAGKYSERLDSIKAKLAQVLTDAAQYDAALTLIRTILAKDERYTNALLLTRSKCYLATGQPRKALEPVVAVIERDAKAVQAYLLRAQALIALMRYKEAVDSINQALQFDPSNPQIAFYKAQALIEGNIDLKQGIRLLRHYIGRVGRTEALLQTQSPTIAARRDDENAQYFLAQFQSIAENHEEALERVNRALELGFRSESYYLYAPAQQLKAELLQDTSPIEAAVLFHQAGRSYNEVNNFEAAIDVLQTAKKLNPDHAPIYWDLSNALCASSNSKDYPYVVDPKKIEESQAAWEEGTNKRLPDADYSWVYILRADINEHKRRLIADAYQTWKLLWEAIAYVERAILLLQEDVIRWAMLGTYHRILNNEACALDATARALRYDDKNTFAWSQRSSILANMGEFAEAEKALDESLKLATVPDMWSLAVKVYIILHSINPQETASQAERLQEAFELINEVIDKSPRDIWFRSLRILYYHIVDDMPSARDDLDTIWKEYQSNPSEKTDENQVGRVAYYLNRFDEAIEFFKQLLDDPTQEQQGSYWDLGLCYLMKGDLPTGKEYLSKSIEMSVNARQLSDLIYLDLRDIERATASRPDSTTIRAILDATREKILVRKTQISQERFVEVELQQIIAKLAAQEETDGPAYIASHAALARFNREQRRWSEAVREYQFVQKHAIQFPEVHIGLEMVFDALLQEGDQLLKDGNMPITQPLTNDLVAPEENQPLRDKTHEALDHYSQLARLELLHGDKERSAQLFSHMGYAYFESGNSPYADEHFIKAIQLARESNILDAGTQLGNHCRPLLRDTTAYWALDAAWKTLASKYSSDGSLQNAFEAARRSLARYLDDVFQLSKKSINSGEMFPIADRICIEVSQDQGLIAGVLGKDPPFFKIYIPEMREQIRKEIGIQLPSVMVRDSSEIPDNGYSIKFEDGLIVSGKVQPGMGYCAVSLEALQKLEIPTQALVETPHPFTGEPGYWVPSDSWQIFHEHNLPLWEDPWLFVRYHLEAVVRQNLALLLSIQDVDALIEIWKKEDRGPALIQEALPDQLARLRLAKVLHALLREHVPIVDWENILEALQSFPVVYNNIHDLVHAARLKLKKWLPGNAQDARHFKLSQEITEAIAQRVAYKDGKIHFVASPEETQNLIFAIGCSFLPLPEKVSSPEEIWHYFLAISSQVDSTKLNFVLVIDKAEIRAFVRQLVAEMFPALMVLSQEELLSPQAVTTGNEQERSNP